MTYSIYCDMHNSHERKCYVRDYDLTKIKRLFTRLKKKWDLVVVFERGTKEPILESVFD